MIAHARLGGEDGMKMSRVVFAVMIKFSHLYESLEEAINEVDI